MADKQPEVVAQKTETKSTVVLDWSFAIKNLEKVKAETRTQYAGKPGCNPALWIKRNIVPLEQQIATGNKSMELYDKCMSLKVVEPKV